MPGCCVDFSYKAYAHVELYSCTWGGRVDSWEMIGNARFKSGQLVGLSVGKHWANLRIDFFEVEDSAQSCSQGEEREMTR